MLRYTLAAGCLLVGLLLVAQGLVVTPMVTSETCTASATAGETPTATPECTRTTEPARGQQFYIVGLGLSIGGLGAGIVVVDRRLAGR